MNGNQGAISQPAGLFPSCQTQGQLQVGCFPAEQKQSTDNYVKRQESGTHTPDEQVRAGMYKNGHTVDPVREEIICLQYVANKWEQQHPDNKQETKCCQYLETHPRPRKQHEEQYEYPDNSNKSISIISTGLEKLTNINERLVDNFQCLSKTPLQQAALDAISSFDGNNKADTTSWPEQVELLAKRGKESAVEIAMAKLKGNPLRIISTLKKETCLIMWDALKNTLLKTYSDVPYRSNAMAKYFAVRQGEDDSCTQYLIRARDLLERGHSTRKLKLINAESFHIPLLKGLWDRWVGDRASKQLDKWTTMDEVFSLITFYVNQSNKTKIYNEPEYEGELTFWVSEVHHRQGLHQYQPKGQSYSCKDRYQKQGHNKYLGSPQNQQQVDRQQHDKPHKYDDHKNNKDVRGLKCYHCEGPHYISQCEEYQKEKSRYQEKHQNMKKRMVSKLHRFADNNCICISEAFFDKEDNQDLPAPQLTEEEINELCQALEYSDSE